MSLGTPVFPASLDSDSTLGPTSGIIAGNTLLGSAGTNQGDQLGITKNLINSVMALQSVVGVTASAVTTSLVYLVGKLQTSAFLAGILNNSNTLGLNSQIVNNNYLGTVTTNQTVDCTNAAFVSTELDVSTAFNPTMTFTNVSYGTQFLVSFMNSSTGTRSATFIATNPATTAFNWQIKGTAGVTASSGSITYSAATTAANVLIFASFINGSTPTMRGIVQ
jgi:hypothetical protein